MGHACFCVKPDLNLDGGHLLLGISPWQETLRIEATDHPGRDAMVTETSAESFFGCLIDFYPIAPKVRRDRKGGFKTPKTPSDTIGRLTRKTLMREETTGS